MRTLPFSLLRTAALSALISLAGCGGGSSVGVGSNGGVVAPLPVPVVPAEPAPDAGAPLATGDVAQDLFNWFNFRREQLTLLPVRQNLRLDDAAQGHAEYQAINGILTHLQTVGQPGFTGVTQEDRIANAGYQFTQFPNAYGEVLAASTDPSGFNLAESLIAAIYHRYVVFEPVFTDAGTGAALGADGLAYVTANFAADGLGNGLGFGRAVVYPFPGQQGVPNVFLSDTESPDPVPGVNEVGYPVSIHGDIEASISVSRFTIRPRSGPLLPTRLLTNANDPATPRSAVALIPLTVLQPRTVYDVEFSGVVDNTPVDVTWSFATR